MTSEALKYYSSGAFGGQIFSSVHQGAREGISWSVRERRASYSDRLEKMAPALILPVRFVRHHCPCHQRSFLLKPHRFMTLA